ncbi:efflux RND transporter permease subunit [Candidatus Symbiobacter mobilis]|uniref:Multidrug efflux pump subunit n=1 Tax=Candidatus Symbiobacter mobilis CR TaxID=946483 RepID=U5N5M0_9BURK|nr:efflux RND transporter permease subunit [Candidatus Symbiobacter mobilis]AGX86811.1 multidrug efflux pump subunit [Candidatus Symbiobacter mobilis CR]
MNLATWSVRKPTPSVLLFVLLTLAGIWGFRNLGVQHFPDLDLPTINVMLVQPGAAPAQLETEVARKVEDAMATLQGLKHLRTSVTDGRVAMYAEFDIRRPLSDCLLDVKDAVDRVRKDLPADVEEPQVNKVTIAPGGPMLTYAISHSAMDEEALSWFVDDTVSRAVLRVPGVGQFTRVGGVQREVQVEVDPARLAAVRATAADVSRALRRVQLEASGGRGQLGGAEQGVRTLATVRRAEELAALPIALADGRSLRLDQVATVRDTTAQRTQAALLDGKPVVGVQIARTRGYDETRIAEGIAQALEALQRKHPGMGVTVVRSTVDFTLEQYRGSMEMLYEGAILAVLVIWWFLRDWRATLIGAAALPLSILPAFAVMAWFGFTLNTLTLLALAVVVGILVDDAIVEVENIARHLRGGKSVLDATIDAVEEIALAVVTTTATLVVVFVPTALMSGIPGLVFRQFGWTVVAAVLASLLVARLMTPVMAMWLLRGGHSHDADGRWMQGYLRMAGWCIRHRKTTLLAGLAFFLGSLALVPLLPTGFVPPRDEGSTSIAMELPPGASLERSLSTIEEVRQAIADVEGIRAVFATVGAPPLASGPGSGPLIGELRKGSLTLVLAPRGERPTQQQVEDAVRERLAGIAGVRLSIGQGTGKKLQVILASQDAPTLRATALQVERDLRGLPFLSGIASTASLERPEITVRPHAALAAERGVSTQAIGETLRIALSGDVDTALSQWNLDTRQVDIRVQVGDAIRHDLDAIGALRVPGRGGVLVPLSSIAELRVESGPAQIDRYNRERQVTINADLGGYSLSQAIEERNALPSIRSMPASVRLIESGDAELMVEMLGGFAMALLTGILLVYAVLVLLFHDWFLPITILSAVPLSLGGVFVAVLAAGYELGMPVLIGMVMLLGIVTKNSILLADFAVMAHETRGMALVDALMDACHKRARPILMTTVAMVAGMLPLALGLGGDASFRQPMAVAVIGGLVTSTGLSLLVVPVVFLYVSDLEAWLRSFLPGREKAGK